MVQAANERQDGAEVVNARAAIPAALILVISLVLSLVLSLAVEFALMAASVGAALAATTASSAPAVPMPSAAAQPPCGGAEIARGEVGRVVDGRDFVLADGRAVHLAGIEVPLTGLPRQSGAAPGGAAARKALAALLAGARVVLRRVRSSSDRYGRIVAYVDALRGNSERSVQAELVAAGFARVGADVEDRDCAGELLRREIAARRAKRGLWVDSYYDPLPADDPAEILARRGRFALVEGKVVSVHASRAILYVNFGRHWWRDFSVTVRKRNETRFAAAGLNLKDLAGRRVRVRGFVEARGGPGVMPWYAPWIEVAYPDEIEPADR